MRQERDCAGVCRVCLRVFEKRWLLGHDPWCIVSELHFMTFVHFRELRVQQRRRVAA